MGSIPCPALGRQQAGQPGSHWELWQGTGKWATVESGVVDELGTCCRSPGPRAEVAQVHGVKYGGKQRDKTEGRQQSNPGK